MKINQVVVVNTEKDAEEVMQSCLKIEVNLGRKRTTQGYGARTIDIDVLFVNDEVIETESLVLPHPRMHLRKFALFPLVELIPDFIHPTFQKSIQELLLICEDNSEVRKI